jgi:hypothetical protein
MATGGLDRTISVWEPNPYKLIGQVQPYVVQGYTN